MNMFRVFLVSLLMGVGLCFAQDNRDSASNASSETLAAVQPASDGIDGFDFDAMGPALEQYAKEHPIEYHEPNFCELQTQRFLAWIAMLPGVIPAVVKIKEWWAGKTANGDAIPVKDSL